MRGAGRVNRIFFHGETKFHLEYIAFRVSFKHHLSIFMLPE